MPILLFVDIDQDGDVDAFMSQPNGDILFYKNTGNKNQPLFSAPVTNPFGLSNTGSYSSPTFADIDSDGDMDAFVGEYSDVIFFRNTGNATAASFVKSSDSLGLYGGSYNSPTLTDIDDDGDLDAFIGTGNYNGGGLNFFRNIGTVDNPVFYADSASRFSLIDTNNYISPTFADIDGDGDPDSFITQSNSLLFQENIGSGSVPDFSIYIENGGINDYALSPISSTTFVDIDGDGDLDAFIGQGNNNYSYLDNNGSTIFFRNIGTANQPSFAPEVKNPFGLSDVGDTAKPAFIDIDGDRDLDAFVGNSAGSTIFFRNVGTINTPVFASSQTNPFGLSNVSEATPRFVDIDKDGDADAFIGRSYFKNIGTANNPIFATPQDDPFGFSGNPEFIDFDHDGDFDAIVGSSVFINTVTANNPTFLKSNFSIGYPLSYTNETFIVSQTIVDIDGDSDFDIFRVGVYESSLVYSYFNINNTAPNVANLAIPERYSKGVPLNLNDIIVSDSDSADIKVTLTLSDKAAGGLSTSTVGSVTSAYNASTGIWIASGALESVNALLANLSFFPATSFSNSFTITANISDGAASPLIATKEFSITNNNLLLASPKNDILVGTTDNDIVSYASATGAITVSLLNNTTAQNTVNSGQDKLTGIKNLIGSAFADILTGDNANNVIDGGAGNDTIRGWSGQDIMIGGNGNDTYYVENIGDLVIEKPAQGTDQVSSTITYTLGANIENLTLLGSNAVNGAGNSLNNKINGNAANNELNGEGGIDTILGNNGNDVLNGGSGNDVLNGGNGNDILMGDSGSDRLIGGAGIDIFRFITKDALDTIVDYNVSADTIQLENSVFTALKTPGVLAASQFRIGTKALDSNDFVIYNKSTGAILYDADGNGSTAATQIAKIGIGLALTQNDFVIV
ncbi:MAG: FG-GAP-like repeat-containing protein [Nitrosomonas sp.]